MSRPLPLLLLLLVVVTGAALSVRLLWQPTAAVHGAAPTGEPVSQSPSGTSPVDPSAPTPGHVMTYVFEEPASVNPFTTPEAVARRYVLAFTHDTLLDLDPVSGALRGSLAQDWEIAPDGTSVTMTLRPGVRFCDGSELTVDDVRYTFEVAQGVDIVLGHVSEGLALVRAVQVLDGSPPRLQIELKEPFYDPARVIGLSWVVVQKRFFERQLAAVWQRLGHTGVPSPATPGFGAAMQELSKDPGPGTGPYAFCDEGPRPSWRPGQDLWLTRNEHSWRRQQTPGSWNLGGIRILFLKNQDARFAALLQRSLDVYQEADLDGLLRGHPDLQSDYRKVVFDSPNAGVYLVQWNLRRPQLADPRVRKALSMLFDRAAFVKHLFGGDAAVAVAYSRPNQPDYPHDLQPPPFDPTAARQLLAEAGFDPEHGERLRIELLVPGENPVLGQMAQAAHDAAGRAGVDLVLRVSEFRLLMARTEQGDWDGFMVLSIPGQPVDPFATFHSEGTFNVMGYHNAEVDEVLVEARRPQSPAERRRLLGRFHQLVADDQPVAFLVHPRASFLINSHLRAAEPGPLGLWPERFWVEPRYQRQLK